MGRWSGLSSLIDFHFEHGHGSYRNGKSGVNLTTRYHKLDDSIFVLCRNCGQSMKSDDLKKVGGYAGRESSQRQRTNPKHFLTWSATAANNRIQKMSKHFANNISKLQMKVEKAIPFQQGVNTFTSEEFCSGSCESKKASQCEQFPTRDLQNDQENNNSTFLKTNPDVVVNVTNKVPTDTSSNCSTSNNTNSANLTANNVVQQCEDGNRYHYHSRVQSARIVQSRPSVSHSHSHGSVANPDKILQINIDSYQKYSSKELNSFKNIKDKSKLLKNIAVDDCTNNEKEKNKNMQLEMQPVVGLINAECYDSGTGSGNTSMSDSSLSTVATLPMNSLNWSRASSVSGLGSNLNSSSPSPNQQHPQLNCDNNSNSKSLCNKMTVKVHSPVVNKGKEEVINQHDSNSTNSGVPITCESTDETSLLIENNKSNHKKGMRIGCVRNVEIRNNNKNLVPSQDQQNLGSPIATSTPLKIQALISKAYPPSKLTVTIFEEETELRHAPWFQAGIPREIALEVLRNEPIGSFIVRESTTKSGCFALTIRCPKDFQPSGIAHYLILKTSRGYKIKGFTKEFGSLSSLITHHSVMSELLPCPLSLHQYRPNTLRISRADSSDFMEPEKLIVGAFTNF